MMFYRTDILADLGLDVPKTWDELLALIPILQFNNMEIGMSQDYTMYMYQLDGHLWADDGMRINLDANRSLESFETMCNMFTQYSLPVSYDFANRFRTGEMPVGVASYTLYNQLKVFAPEISGLWEFVQLPGVEKADGSINHTTPVTVGAVMMMKDAADDISADQDYTDSRRAQNSWKYLQWWVSTDTQARFGKEQVAIMGTAAKYNTANSKALISQSWTAQEKKNLSQQFRSLKGTPMSPGNYIVARYTNFAFYNVVDGGEVASEAMLGYVDDINNELTRKREEYNFLTIDEYKAGLEAANNAE